MVAAGGRRRPGEGVEGQHADRAAVGDTGVCDEDGEDAGAATDEEIAGQAEEGKNVEKGNRVSVPNYQLRPNQRRGLTATVVPFRHLQFPAVHEYLNALESSEVILELRQDPATDDDSAHVLSPRAFLCP